MDEYGRSASLQWVEEMESFNFIFAKFKYINWKCLGDRQISGLETTLLPVCDLGQVT